MAAETKNPEAAGLDSLANEIAAAAAPPLGEGSTDLDVAAGAGQQDEPVIPNREIIAGAIEGARDTFCAFTGLMTPAITLTEAKIQKVADIWDKVCTRRGWNLQSYMGKNADLYIAIYATGQILAGMVVAARAELAMRNAKEPQPDGAAAPADAAPLETPTSGG